MRTRSSLVTPALFTLALAFATVGCKKQTYDFDTRSPAHAGQAEVVLTVDKKTGNGKIEFSFEHLAPPERIDKSLRAYVAWAQSDGKDPYKLGVIDYKEKKRSGTLEATFSDDQMKIIVTIEKDPSVDAPVGTRVIESDVVAPKP